CRTGNRRAARCEATSQCGGRSATHAPAGLAARGVPLSSTTLTSWKWGVSFIRPRPLRTVYLLLLSERSHGVGPNLPIVILRRLRCYRLRRRYFLAPGKRSEERIRVFPAGTARVLRFLPGTRLAYCAADDGLAGRLSWRWHSAGDLPDQLLRVL